MGVRLFLLLAGCAICAGSPTFAQESTINGSATSATPVVAVAEMPTSARAVRLTQPVTKVISHQSAYYHGWPTVAARRDGSLVLIYSGGRDYHVCPFGRLDAMTSHDGGETWSWPRTIMDSLTDDAPNWDLGYPSTAQLADGSLVTVWYEAPANTHRAVLRQAKWRVALE